MRMKMEDEEVHLILWQGSLKENSGIQIKNDEGCLLTSIE